MIAFAIVEIRSSVVASALALWPLVAAASAAEEFGDGARRASLYLCAEPVVIAQVKELRVRGDGFVPIQPPPTETPTPGTGTPSPHEILAKIPLGKAEPERRIVPVYTAYLTVEVLKVEADRGSAAGMIAAGDRLSIQHEGLPAQPEYHVKSVVRLKLRLHADQKDPRKASYQVWQLVEASPPLSPEEASGEPPLHLHVGEGDLARRAAYAREFVRAVPRWQTYDGLKVPDVGAVSVEEKGGTFTCLIGAEPVRREKITIGGESATAQELHDWAVHERASVTPVMVDRVYRMWKYLRSVGAVGER